MNIPDDLDLPVGGPVRSDLERAYERIRELNAELQRALERAERAERQLKDSAGGWVKRTSPPTDEEREAELAAVFGRTPAEGEPT